MFAVQWHRKRAWDKNLSSTRVDTMGAYTSKDWHRIDSELALGLQECDHSHKNLAEVRPRP